MKRTVMVLMAFAIVFNMAAMGLKEAFDVLSNIPYVSVKVDDAPSTIVIDGTPDHIGAFRVATASRLDARQIQESGNAALAILNQVPLSHMINGGSNGLVGAFLYAVPALDGKYDFLLVAMNGYGGDISIIYTTIDEATKLAFQNARLTMEEVSLTLLPRNTDGSSAFKVIIKSKE